MRRSAAIPIRIVACLLLAVAALGLASLVWFVWTKRQIFWPDALLAPVVLNIAIPSIQSIVALRLSRARLGWIQLIGLWLLLIGSACALLPLVVQLSPVRLLPEAHYPDLGYIVLVLEIAILGGGAGSLGGWALLLIAWRRGLHGSSATKI